MKLLTKIRGFFNPTLSENDQAQAQILGMGLAALKASEINAQIIVKQGKALETLQHELLNSRAILAHYTIAANEAKTRLEGFTPGTVEYEGMLMMSSKLYDLAQLVENMSNTNRENPDVIENKE